VRRERRVDNVVQFHRLRRRLRHRSLLVQCTLHRSSLPQRNGTDCSAAHHRLEVIFDIVGSSFISARRMSATAPIFNSGSTPTPALFAAQPSLRHLRRLRPRVQGPWSRCPSSKDRFQPPIWRWLLSTRSTSSAYTLRAIYARARELYAEPGAKGLVDHEQFAFFDFVPFVAVDTQLRAAPAVLASHAHA
jgi:hypothetical protein